MALRALALALAALSAACQPLPHPFADSVAAPSIPALRPPDSAGIVVLPVEGAPARTAAALAEALAQALRDADVPASTEGQNRGSFRLAASAEAQATGAGRSAVLVAWQLRNADGTLIGRGTARRDTASEAWQDGNRDLVAALAGQAAPVIARLVSGDAPPGVVDTDATVAVGGVTGAPGDGGTALARAIGAALGRAGVEVATGAAKARFTLACAVALTAQPDGKQHVAVRWVLSAADGRRIGVVALENTVPAGALDGPWGDIAYVVASAAAPGIAQLIERATAASAGG